MTDLRRKVGRKAISTSTKTSRQSSRANSRAASEDEGVGSDGDWSVASNETVDSVTGDPDISFQRDWDQDLLEAIEGLIERKGSSTQGREELLCKIVRIMSLKYTSSTLEGREADLAEASLRCLSYARTDKESSYASRSLSLLALTKPSFSALYDMTAPSLRKQITNSPSIKIKRACLQALGAIAFFCASAYEMEAVMGFLLEAIESDGYTLESGGEESVVIGAIEAYAFLLSSVDEPEDVVQQATPILVDQLEAGDVGVRMAAGLAIALIYELDEEINSDDDTHRRGPYYNVHLLTTLLAQLSTSSNKKMSKVHRRTQHSSFRDILATVSNPSGSAPYSTLKFGNTTYAIDSWTKAARLQYLRNILTHGFHVHFSKNEAVRDCLEYHGGVPGDNSSDDSDNDSVASSHEVRARINKEMKRMQDDRVRHDRSRSGKGMQREWGNGYDDD